MKPDLNYYSTTIFIGLLLLAQGTVSVAIADMTAVQSQGKQIYLKGTSPSGDEITATVGSEGVTLPASAAPCASCHGPDGLGRAEAGVQPPDIRWSELTKVYGHLHNNGRKHPAFDEKSLSQLIQTGVDTASNRLDRSMPLYTMSARDMDSLVAYIRYLENDLDPGISTDRILIGTLLPLQGALGGLGQAMAQVMYAHIQEINNRGGIFGRKLELLAIPYGDSTETTLNNLSAAIDKEGVFALVGAYTVGMDDQVLDLLGERDVPLIGPFTLDPGDAFVHAGSFYIYPGFAEQVVALIGEALNTKQTGTGTPLLLAGPESDHIDRLLATVKQQLSTDTADSIETLRYQQAKMNAADIAERLKKINGDAVLFLGNSVELESLLRELDGRKQHPRIYMLSAFSSRLLYDSPQAFDKRIFLAYPTLASDLTAAGRAEYQRLAMLHALPPDHLQGQVAALAAVKLLEEGLRGAGHSLSRTLLVESIEALYQYDTGLTPPLTYGPNRRIGARGAYIVAVDLLNKTNTSVGGWHAVR